MSWFGWVLLAFWTFWVAGLICVIFISVIPYCWRCFEHRFFPKRVRHNQNMLIRNTLVTKKVVHHDEISQNQCILIENGTNDDEVEQQVPLTTETRDVGVDLENGSGSTITDNGLDTHHCPICLEPFKHDENVSWSRQLIKCKHVYHTNCISAWLAGGQGDCPCCRRNYFSLQKESGMNCFGSRKDNIGNDNSDAESNVIKSLSEGQFCLVHGLCMPVSEEEALANGINDNDQTGHDSHVDSKNES